MPLPTSRRRYDLLQECLTWVGKYYEGGSVADCCHVAVREVLNLPLDDRPIKRDMFYFDEYDRAFIPYGELLGLGLVDTEVSDADLHIANTIRRTLQVKTSQPDLTEAQLKQLHLDAMVAGLELWLVNTPGGVGEAVQALFLLMHGDCSTAPFV